MNRRNLIVGGLSTMVATAFGLKEVSATTEIAQFDWENKQITSDEQGRFKSIYMALDSESFPYILERYAYMYNCYEYYIKQHGYVGDELRYFYTTLSVPDYLSVMDHNQEVMQGLRRFAFTAKDAFRNSEKYKRTRVL